MKIIVDYNPITGYVTFPDGCQYLTIISANIEEYNEKTVKEDTTSKLTINDIIDLKRANVI